MQTSMFRTQRLRDRRAAAPRRREALTRQDRVRSRLPHRHGAVPAPQQSQPRQVSSF